MSLFDGLKRRRVFRVTAAYVVGAWVVLQVADTLFPALHLPPSSVTLVAVLVVLGFPVAMLLGWAFDVTPDGIARTPGSLKLPARVAAVGTVAIALAVTAFVAWRRHAVAARLDANAVAILPFRVSGDASLAAMREGMIDLLAVKLTGEGGGPDAIDSRTTLSAWRRKIEDENDDLPTADAVQLARSLGAGQILQGEVVGTPGRVALSVTLHSAIDGSKLAMAQDAASPDSILPLVDRVVAKLLSVQAGVGMRADALLSESLPAVRAYLEGQRLLRLGDYATATQRFHTALEQDSTFALAGLGLAQAAAWTEDTPGERSGMEVALKYRSRLPLPDREYVDAAFGYGESKSALERIRIFRAMVARAPDRIEAWHLLGELYFHHGAAIGIEDPLGKALAAWRSALALDSTYMPAVEHQIGIFAQLGDTLNVRRVADFVFKRVQPQRRYNSGHAWVAALALNDESWLKELRARMNSMDRLAIDVAVLDIVESGLPQQDVPALIAKSQTTPGEGLEGWQSFMLATIGRPNAALAYKSGPDDTGNEVRKVMISWIHREADAGDMLAFARRGARTPNAGSAFVSAEYCLEHGDLDCAQAGAASMRAALESLPHAPMPPFAKSEAAQLMQIGAAMLAAGIKAKSRASDARTELARADSLLLHTNMSAELLPGPGTMFALASTRAHIALGDDEGAYAAAKRGAGTTFGFVGRAPLLLEYARAAARLNKREEAIAAYRRYLILRPQPEPGPVSKLVEQARHELALLMREPR